MRRMQFGLLLALSLVATGLLGCGGGSGDSDKKEKEKKSSQADQQSGSEVAQKSGSASTDAAAGGQTEPKWVLGSWEGQLVVDQNKVVESLKARAATQKENISDEEIKGILKTLQSLKMMVSFVDNGTMEMVAQMAIGGQQRADKTTGHWQVINLDGNKVTIRSKDSTKAVHEDIEIMFQGKDEFHMKPPAEFEQVGSMQFKRLR